MKLVLFLRIASFVNLVTIYLKKPCVQNPPTDPNLPDLSFYRKGYNSHKTCTFGCKDTANLFSIPKTIRQELLTSYKFLTFKDARLCSNHIGISNYWPLVKQVVKQVNAEEQQLVCDLMFEFYQELKDKKKVVFDLNTLDSIDDSTFKSWFAYDKEQFRKICSFSETCEPKQVVVFLCKLRTDLSNNLIASLFGICEKTIYNYLTLVREDLLTNLVPKFINCKDRAVLVAHKINMSKVLFDIPDDKTCIIFDATYRLAQKSKNFAGQKQLWSEQKKMPLVKPMVGCSSDGWVLFVLGPYDATHNDATILEDCFSRYSNVMNTIQKEDIILVDRGFRDVVDFLTNEKNLKVYSPGLGQLNTTEANMSRSVTKCRWIVEQVFGRLKKKFKIFSIPAHNSTLAKDYESLLIASSFMNLFHKPILSDKMYEDIAHIIKSRMNVPNRLKDIVEEFNLSQVRSVC